MKSNSLSILFSALKLTLASVLMFSQAGCETKTRNDSNSVSRDDDARSEIDPPTLGLNANLDGRSILEQSIARYANATSYQDQAVLYLSYRLEGRGIQEPHPFSTCWRRDNRLASKIFNGQIHCDGQQLGCYIFDIESANLDNQHLLLAGIDDDSVETALSRFDRASLPRWLFRIASG